MTNIIELVKKNIFLIGAAVAVYFLFIKKK